jgi:hypothetical protein
MRSDEAGPSGVLLSLRLTPEAAGRRHFHEESVPFSKVCGHYCFHLYIVTLMTNVDIFLHWHACIYSEHGFAVFGGKSRLRLAHDCSLLLLLPIEKSPLFENQSDHLIGIIRTTLWLMDGAVDPRANRSQITTRREHRFWEPNFSCCCYSNH